MYFENASVWRSTSSRSVEFQTQTLAHRVGLFLVQRRLSQGAALHVVADGGVVTLRGHVATFHQRQLIHSLVRHVAGVLRVIDELNVVAPGGTYTV